MGVKASGRPVERSEDNDAGFLAIQDDRSSWVIL